MKFKTNLRIKSNIIDPVPIINVMVLFVGFFVLASQFVGGPGVVVALPKIEQAGLYNIDGVVITLADSKMYLFNKEIEKDKLREELTKRNPKLLAIKADKNIAHYKVTEIISLAQQIGIKEIAIAAETSRK